MSTLTDFLSLPFIAYVCCCCFHGDWRKTCLHQQILRGIALVARHRDLGDVSDGLKARNLHGHLQESTRKADRRWFSIIVP